MEFSKYNGCGNDFILIDTRSNPFCADDPQLIPRMCTRCTGIGADGVILLEESKVANFKMRIFNQDGSEAEMCGNGIRCLVQFILDLGYSESSMTIETLERIITGSKTEEGIAIKMGAPTNVRWNLEVNGQALSVLNTGVPHAVMFVEDLGQIDVASQGRQLRHDPLFAPNGTNVTFTQVLGPQHIRFCTYERGVEAETLACGTGAAAAALTYSHVMGQPSPIDVETKHGDIIKIYFNQDLDVTMVGPAKLVYTGTLPLPQNALN